MPVNDELGKRMKEYYEQVPKAKLMRRTPVAIRIDGKAFHTFTRGFEKPFDYILIKAMQETTKYLCENIQGCVFGYTQSDEITLILVDYKKLNSSAWFDYEVQKMCSIAASMATMAFNKNFQKEINTWMDLNGVHYIEYANIEDNVPEHLLKQNRIYWDAYHKGAMFDARCFNIPKEEVANLIYWRQLDATRNSIQMVGQANFSQKELQGKSCNMIQDMLLTQKGINWNNYPAYNKRGTACIKVQIIDHFKFNGMSLQGAEGIITESHSEWIIDKDMPIIKDNGRQYVEQYIFVGE